MKFIMFSVVLTVLTCVRVSSQPLKLSELFWVVETNKHHRSYSIVRFYDHNNVKVHEVKINGVFINIRKQKQRRKLDQLLKLYNERLAIASKRNLRKHSFESDGLHALTNGLRCGYF